MNRQVDFPKPILFSAQHAVAYDPEYEVNRTAPPSTHVQVSKVNEHGTSASHPLNYTRVKEQSSHNADAKKKMDLLQEDYETICGFIATGGMDRDKWEDPSNPFMINLTNRVTHQVQFLQILYEDEDTGKLYSYGYHPDPVKCTNYASFYKGALGLDVDGSPNAVNLLYALHGLHGCRHTVDDLPSDLDERTRWSHDIKSQPQGMMDANKYCKLIKAEIEKCSWWRSTTNSPLLIYLRSCSADSPDGYLYPSMLRDQIIAAIHIRNRFGNQTPKTEPSSDSQPESGDSSEVQNLKDIITHLMNEPIVPIPTIHSSVTPKSIFPIPPDIFKKRSQQIIKNEVILILMNVFGDKSIFRNIRNFKNKIEQKKCDVNDNLSSGTPVYVDTNVISTEQRDMEGILNPDIQNTGIGGALLPTVLSGFR
jgi:hypothetical protein